VPIEYEERILLYVDVLGWSALIKQADSDPLKKDLLARSIDRLISFHAWARMKKVASETGWQIALASDSLFASAPVMGEHFDEFLLEVARLARSLLFEGIYVRGAIVQGRLLHNREIIVGPAVVKAVEIENETKFPRIQIDESVLHRFQSTPRWIYRDSRNHPSKPSFDFIRFWFDRAADSPLVMAAEIDKLLKIVDEAGTTRSEEKLIVRDRWMKEYLSYQTGTWENSK